MTVTDEQVRNFIAYRQFQKSASDARRVAKAAGLLTDLGPDGDCCDGTDIAKWDPEKVRRYLARKGKSAFVLEPSELKALGRDE